jgi:hypothetical protein
MKDTYIVITNGSYVNGPLVEKIELTDAEMEELEFDDWTEYEDHIFSEHRDEAAQYGASCIILNEEEYASLIERLKLPL